MGDQTNEQSHSIPAQAVSGFFQSFPVLANSLTDQQRTALRFLLMGNSQTVVAQHLGVTPRTIYNWLHDPVFRRALHRLRRELWSQALDRLRTLVHPSLAEMETQLRNGNEKTRYRSANALLRHANVKKAVPVELSEEEQDDDIENE